MKWTENSAHFERLVLQFLENQFKNADAAHDVLHIRRVVETAQKIGREEQADWNILAPAAWLHDCVLVPKDSPDRHVASRMAAKTAVSFLASLDYDEKLLQPVFHAIEAHSFSAAITPETLEAQVLQDSDRLDALGAIGIARCFATSGKLNRPFYEAIDPFCEERPPDDRTFTIDHFYTKLFRLESTMQTEGGKREAARRTRFMVEYLTQLKAEIGF
jgi:uncharacterized protein